MYLSDSILKEDTADMKMLTTMVLDLGISFGVDNLLGCLGSSVGAHLLITSATYPIYWQ